MITRLLQNSAGDPVQLRRWRFDGNATVEVATTLLDEALAAGEAAARALRATAEQATRRAMTAGQRMRPTSSARRTLETEAATAMNAYLNRSQEIARQCAEAQAQLAEHGFPTGERPLPAWISEVQHILASHE